MLIELGTRTRDIFIYMIYVVPFLETAQFTGLLWIKWTLYKLPWLFSNLRTHVLLYVTYFDTWQLTYGVFIPHVANCYILEVSGHGKRPTVCVFVCVCAQETWGCYKLNIKIFRGQIESLNSLVPFKFRCQLTVGLSCRPMAAFIKLPCCPAKLPGFPLRHATFLDGTLLNIP